MDDLGDEEQQFVQRLLITGDIEGSARGTIVDETAPSTYVRKTAMQALGDTATKAFIIDLFEGEGITPQFIAKTLREGMETNKFGISQKTGEVVDLGPDGMTRMTAVKMALQSFGVLGGGVKAEPTDQKPAPTQINIVFPGRDIRSKKEDVIIDGDDSYSARS